MILTYRRPGPPDTHAMTMVNNVIEVLNYVIAARPLPLNSVIADSVVAWLVTGFRISVGCGDPSPMSRL